MKEREDSLYGIKPAEILKMDRILKWMEEVDTWDESQLSRLEMDRKNFSVFFREHDRRRGTSFKELFPDLHSFY